ncbi:MAG: chemotaxis protein CheW [Nannocystis sp.]|nr:chemotaxis protein CheW [Nannocystis sp.]MBA3547060.1 chemotaxis protein CheW [Nannocystis sp.]
MSAEREDLWTALLRSGEALATDEDYEHGYKRDVPQDLQQYVTFRVAGEIYALPIHEIEEISKVFATTHVPRTADFLVGIGNVRGRIMPVVDLARRLRLRPVERGRSARVLIVQLNDEPYGLVVDAVIDVTRIPPDKIEDKPGGITGARAEFIRGLGRRKASTLPRAGGIDTRTNEVVEDIVIILNLVTLLDPTAFVRAGAGEEGRG